MGGNSAAGAGGRGAASAAGADVSAGAGPDTTAAARAAAAAEAAAGAAEEAAWQMATEARLVYMRRLVEQSGSLETSGDGMRRMDDAQLGALMRIFARHDVDLDGALTLAEFDSLMRQLELGETEAEAEAEPGAEAGGGGGGGALWLGLGQTEAWSGGADLGTRLAFQRANLNGGGNGGSIDFNELVILLGTDPHAPRGTLASASAFPSASASAAAHGAAPRGQQRLASLLGAPAGGTKAWAARHRTSQEETYDALLVDESSSMMLEYALEQLGDSALERAKLLFEAFDSDRCGSLGLTQFAALLNRAARDARAPGTAWAVDPTAPARQSRSERRSNRSGGRIGASLGMSGHAPGCIGASAPAASAASDPSPSPGGTPGAEPPAAVAASAASLVASLGAAGRHISRLWQGADGDAEAAAEAEVAAVAVAAAAGRAAARAEANKHGQRWRLAGAGVQATTEQYLPHAQVKELFEFANLTRSVDAAQGAAGRIDFNEFVSLFARGAVPLSYLDTTIGADAVGGRRRDLRAVAARRLASGGVPLKPRKGRRAALRSSEAQHSREARE